MLNRLTRVLKDLVVYPENMRKNLELTGGLFYSQQVMLALTGRGISREEAYRLVQRNAMKVWNQGGTLQDRLKEDPEVMALLPAGEMDGLFDLKHHLQHVNTIYQRVFGSHESSS